MADNITSPLKGKSINICSTCIHKCTFKDVTFCNIDKNPNIFHNSYPVTECVDYCAIENAYPKINVHGIWDWQQCLMYPTPIIVCCKHDIPEFEQNSIDELYPHCNEIASGYNIKLKGFPWVINLAEKRLDTNEIKTYRTNLISDIELNNVLSQIK